MVIWDFPIKKNTKVTKKHPPSVTFNAQMPRFSQTFCTFAAENAAFATVYNIKILRTWSLLN